MMEGWQGDDYLILFDEEESRSATGRYRLEDSLPGFWIVGLRGWDDFIVLDGEGNTHTVPTVPLDRKYLEAFSLPASMSLRSDARFTGKIKWYVKPLIFGGDPQANENLAWLTHEQHAELVVWWNATYRKHTAPKAL